MQAETGYETPLYCPECQHKVTHHTQIGCIGGDGVPGCQCDWLDGPGQISEAVP